MLLEKDKKSSYKSIQKSYETLENKQFSNSFKTGSFEDFGCGQKIFEIQKFNEFLTVRFV